MKERSYEDRARIYLKVAESPRLSMMLARFQRIDKGLTPEQATLHYRRTAECYIYFARPCWEELSYNIRLK